MLLQSARFLRGVSFVKDHVRKHSSHAWKAPNGKQVDSVVVKNSLTNEKNPLILNENRHMSWYICGPTVYDHSHLGHARTYVSFDIIRRILSDHFHCNIFMVIGMTDVDDKILNRAAEKGVNWTTLARTFESDFIHDMQSLNVRSPSLYTRVTEHIPEIIDMTYALLQKGHAYESNGSVYYNIPSLRSGMNKLEPSRSAPRRGDEHEDEGYATDKKSPRDFALWKKTPQDTPGWDSPWGHGRPGWHIECSAMCGTYFGKSLDMHSGGIDLKFPHHENELFQCEGAFGVDQWVNYFLHSGHLHIEGRKMSKSLKNFITIKEFLKAHTADQWRLLCLLHQYNTTMTYHKESMDLVLGTERKIKEFFQNTSVLLRKFSTNTTRRWYDDEVDLQNRIIESRDAIHKALCDDFDTPKTIHTMMSLITDVNKYVACTKEPKVDLILEASSLIDRTLSMYGLYTTQSESTPSSKETDELLDVILQFRRDVRAMSKSKDMNGLFRKCDELRDQTLPQLGFKIEDQADGSSVWKRS